MARTAKRERVNTLPANAMSVAKYAAMQGVTTAAVYYWEKKKKLKLVVYNGFNFEYPFKSKGAKK